MHHKENLSNKLKSFLKDLVFATIGSFIADLIMKILNL